ncbi:MAG: tRNA pseudouridine(13) synthase TruD [Candidatus Aminicenantales bacterium]
MIKAVPEDFVVEERAELPLRPRGEHRVYILKKRHWNTLDLVHHLSRSLGLPPSHFSYGGKKDKHGLTSQFITVQSVQDLSREGKDFSLESWGFMDRPMGPDLLRGNAFTVTIRDLDDISRLEFNVQEVWKTGFPNFFDDQRFRSYDPERGFFAEKILKRHWNGALQVFLTSSGPEDTRAECDRKAALFKNWKDWPLLLNLADDPLEKRIFGFLNDHPKDFDQALHRIPEEEVSMLYAAFQSHLWNESLRRLIRMKVSVCVEVSGREGAYLFWPDLDAETFSYLSSLEIPTAAPKMEFGDDLSRSTFEDILQEKGLSPGSFRTKALRRVYFRSFQRKALIVPEELQVLSSGEDERHPGKKKWTISFVLPRGSYGTMLIKRLSLKPTG